jgi:nucleotide-binding universal stress UspA family protein
MSEVILVLLRRPEKVSTLLNAAARLAGLMGGARVNALAIREPIQVTGLAAEALIGEADAVLDAREHERERVASVRAAFDRWSTEAGEVATTSYWTEEEGNAATIIGERGRRSDIIVAGQPAEDDRMARQAFRAALFGTDRPVLMVPPSANAAFGRCVAIAWRDEKRTVRAVIPALRCLVTAEQVHVLIGVREGAESPVLPSLLREHGIRAQLHVLPIGSGPFGKSLLDKAHQLSVDLLVMGAYAHSPLRALILGGVTSHMLAHADLPVLMRH